MTAPMAGEISAQWERNREAVVERTWPDRYLSITAGPGRTILQREIGGEPDGTFSVPQGDTLVSE